MSWSGLIFVTACIILGIYDGIAVLIYGVDGSISRWISDAAGNSAIIPFVFGVLCGHWFGPMHPRKK